MAIELIALDIDGTLVDENSIVTTANREAVKKAIESDIKVTLVTGRHWDGVTQVMEVLGLPPKTPVVLNNGAIVISGREIWATNFLTPDEVDGVIKFSSKLSGVVTTVFHPKTIGYYCNPPIDRKWMMDRFEAFGMLKIEEAKNPDELSRYDGVKVMLMAKTEEVAIQILKSWPGHLSNLKRCRSYPYLCEINSGSCDKGVGLKVLCEAMGIYPKNVLAVGDGESDVPMLTLAGYAVFVKHSDYLPDLPAHVVVTPDGKQNCGTAWAIQKYLGF